MSWFIWLAGAAVIGGIAYGAYRLISWQSVGGLLSYIIQASMPAILKALKPKPIDKARVREGLDPVQPVRRRDEKK